MSAPWEFALDSEGPQNGDVLVKTAKGKLIALFYDSGDNAKTLSRARSFCRAVSPQWCCQCGKATDEGQGDECPNCRVLLEQVGRIVCLEAARGIFAELTDADKLTLLGELQVQS